MTDLIPVDVSKPPTIGIEDVKIDLEERKGSPFVPEVRSRGKPRDGIEVLRSQGSIVSVPETEDLKFVHGDP
jgi:hypothetical protein